MTTLKYWIECEFSVGYLEKGLDSLKYIAEKLVYQKYEQQKETIRVPSSTATTSQTTSQANFYSDFFGASKKSKEVETKKYRFREQLSKECSNFSRLVEQECNSESFHDFWLEKTKELPILSKVAKILHNIPSTSAFLERFFSISGVVCDPRRLNMKEDLVILRSLLKCNASILRELNNKNLEEFEFE